MLKAGTLVAWNFTPEELKALQMKLTPFSEGGSFPNKPLELEEISCIDEGCGGAGEDWMEISKKLSVLALKKRLQHQVQHFIEEMECILQDWRRMNRRYWRQIWGKFSLRRRITAQLTHLKHLNLQFKRLSMREKSFGGASQEETISKLEKEFEIANELGDWIYELLEHRHSLTLEWCIILLIAGEILIGLWKK